MERISTIYTNDVFDAKQAADYMKINEQTVRRLARDNELPAFKVGGAWRFKKSALDRWAEMQHIQRSAACILVVDDEYIVRDMVRNILESVGYVVETASDGNEALRVIEEITPDLVFLDLMMPGMSGVDVLHEIKKRWPGMQVVILTGHPEGEIMFQALNYSPITLLAKPIRASQMVEAASTILGHRLIEK
jgi:excisionase family DNA binding protein